MRASTSCSLQRILIEDRINDGAINNDLAEKHAQLAKKDAQLAEKENQTQRLHLKMVQPN